ncbi:MAG: hypothetical protein ACYC6A_25675 [Armatimonadota bacterium]
MLKKLLRRGLIPAVCAVLGLILIGCQDNGAVFQEIDPTFTGTYVGSMLPGDGETIENQAVVVATVNGDGTMILRITSTQGVFSATGGVLPDDSVSLTGLINGERVVFTGTLQTNRGFGEIFYFWRNSRTGESDIWAVAQQGVSTINVANSYNGTLTAGAFSGTLSFGIDANGEIVGQAIVNGTPVPLNGGVNQVLGLVMTGTYQGEAIYFFGVVNTTERSAAGTVGIQAGGGVTGTWTAEVPTS